MRVGPTQMAFMGGNSTKATSGINGTPTQAQRAQGIPDSADIFMDDTMRSASGKDHSSAPVHTVPLVKVRCLRLRSRASSVTHAPASNQRRVCGRSPSHSFRGRSQVLTEESGPAVDWLTNRFDLDLSLLSRLGGHSQPRTHRGKEKFPGMTITYALMEALESIAEKSSERARILLKCRVTKLLTKDGGNAVVGVEYEKLDGTTGREMGPVRSRSMKDLVATGFACV